VSKATVLRKSAHFNCTGRRHVCCMHVCCTCVLLLYNVLIMALRWPSMHCCCLCAKRSQVSSKELRVLRKWVVEAEHTLQLQSEIPIPKIDCLWRLGETRGCGTESWS